MFTCQEKKIIINTTPTFEYLIAALNKKKLISRSYFCKMSLLRYNA